MGGGAQGNSKFKMDLTQLQKFTVNRWRGLYRRGMSDECPWDHAICCENVQMSRVGDFSKTNEFRTRWGTNISFTLGYTVVRMFLAAFNNNTLTLITLDTNGNIYQNNNPTPIYSDPTIVDIQLLNMFNKTFILPLCNASPPVPLLVWDGINAVRFACGLPPTGSFAAADGATDSSGGLDIGVHQFAVAFVTNTGFITQPGPNSATTFDHNTGLLIASNFTPVLYTAPGQKKVDLTGIPTGPSDVVARWILVTRGNETLFFFAPGGFINDNTTTSLTLDFFDSQLVISADYLFDLLVACPGGIQAGSLQKYHGSQIVTTSNLVRVSNSGQAESFNNVTGFIQLPDESDGNIARGACEISDVLYFTKSVGIYAVQDNNSGNPSSWPITPIDGGVGAYQPAISTITGSQPALSKDNIFLLGDRDGLFTFNGVVQYPQLTWKIDDTWKRITHGFERLISVTVDIYNEYIYVLLPVDGSNIPNLLLVGDYSEGLDYQNIKWSFYFFPWNPRAISMMNFLDQDGFTDYDYYLRIAGDDGKLYKLEPKATTDNGTAISGFYQHGLVNFGEGNLNIFRYLNARARGAIGNVNLSYRLYPEDLQTFVSPPVVGPVTTFPGRDWGRQINFQNEKMSTFITASGNLVFQRLDIYGKPHFLSRPM